MRRLEAWTAALGAALAAACGGPAVQPTPLEGSAPTVVVPPKDATERPVSLLRHADVDPPPPRSEPQVSDEELATILADAARMVAEGDRNGATLALRRCANRIPASLQCEARLGILLVDVETRRAERRYYLAEAAQIDDPSADPALYQELGEVLVGQAMFAEAVLAFQRKIDRGGADAADWARLAGALQGISGREAEAADALQQAFVLDPTEIRFLYDEGVLRGQVGEWKKGATLLREYLARNPADPQAPKIEVRIAEFDALVKSRGGAPADAGSRSPEGQ